MNSLKHCIVEEVGFQPGLEPGSGFHLYNFIGPEGYGVAVDSTVSIHTLACAGFTQVSVIHKDKDRTITREPIC